MLWTLTSSLSHACATSIVYMLWTSRDIYKYYLNDNHWQMLERDVAEDVGKLSIPETLKSRLLLFVKPVGRHYFSFLRIWFKKIGIKEKWMDKGMLTHSLTIYPIGIINQRETAEKLLRSKTLNQVTAFRIACINFLEVEVLSLWPYVYQYFLNSIVLQFQKNSYSKIDIRNPPAWIPGTQIPRNGAVSEPVEVLYWIGYCLSKERATSLNEVPHFTTSNEDWYRLASELACRYGDVTYFEYTKTSESCDSSYERVFDCLHLSNHLIYFYYHFSQLDVETKTELFRLFPDKCISYFFQWPLSSLFLEDLLGIFDILSQLKMVDWLLVKILEILHGVKYLEHVWDIEEDFKPTRITFSDVYCVAHLQNMWTVLWKKCRRRTRLRFIGAFAFTDNFDNFLASACSQMKCNAESLKKDFQKLFFTNGGALLNFLHEKDLAIAIGNAVSKYGLGKNPNFQTVKLRKFLNFPTFKFRFRNVNHISRCVRFVGGLNIPDRLKMNNRTDIHQEIKLFDFPSLKNEITEDFVTYIQDFLLKNNVNNSLFYL